MKALIRASNSAVWGLQVSIAAGKITIRSSPSTRSNATSRVTYSGDIQFRTQLSEASLTAQFIEFGIRKAKRHRYPLLGCSFQPDQSNLLVARPQVSPAQVAW